ncbi:MAG: alpha/beta hydrolase fold protein [Bacteroidetes bacterium]|jgi:proline iminopeptidase|nr:alpha/beta hydrolase fold protein [Bacteroidota bacterium]
MKKSFLVLVIAALVAVTLTSCDIVEPGEPGLLVPRTVDEDNSIPSIFVNGTQLHSEAFGNPNDPMLIVLHGGPGGDYRNLLNCAKFSEDGFFVVFYDQRGSGLSRRHNKDIYTIQLFLDDLHAIINHYRQRQDQKVFLMGQSWGAMLATAYVNTRLGEVSGVVLSEPGGFTWTDTEEYMKRLRSLEVFDETSNDFVYLDQILTGNDHNELDYRAALQSAADFADGNKVGNAGPSPFWRQGAVCNAAAMEYARDHPFDFTTNLRQYTTEVLFLYSELNEAYGRVHAELVSSAYPNVQLTLISGTGHEIPYFGWDRFYPVARTYLNTIK